MPNGEYGVALTQVCSLFSFLNHNASRDVKALLGKDSQFLKVKSELNSNKDYHHTPKHKNLKAHILPLWVILDSYESRASWYKNCWQFDVTVL